ICIIENSSACGAPKGETCTQKSRSKSVIRAVFTVGLVSNIAPLYAPPPVKLSFRDCPSSCLPLEVSNVELPEHVEAQVKDMSSILLTKCLKKTAMLLAEPRAEGNPFAGKSKASRIVLVRAGC